MRLKEGLRQMFFNSGFNPDQMLITILQLYHNIALPINQDHLFWLAEHKYVYRAIDGKFELTFAIYQDEDEPEIRNKELILQDLSKLVKQYRDLFKGIRSNSIGDKNTVIENLSRFIFDEETDMERIIEVTRRYMENTDMSRMYNADNFIYTVKNGKEVSPLRTAFEEYEETSQNSQFKLL